jgi:spartin
VVYIDVRGVGRRAFLKSSAKGFVKARLKNGEVVKLQGEGREGDGLEVEAGEVEREDDGAVVMGMPEVGRSTALEGREGEKGLTRR